MSRKKQRQFEENELITQIPICKTIKWIMTILIIIISYHKIMPYIGLEIRLINSPEEGKRLEFIQVKNEYKFTCVEHKKGVVHPIHFENEKERDEWVDKMEKGGFLVKAGEEYV